MRRKFAGRLLVMSQLGSRLAAGFCSDAHRRTRMGRPVDRRQGLHRAALQSAALATLARQVMTPERCPCNAQPRGLRPASRRQCQCQSSRKECQSSSGQKQQLLVSAYGCSPPAVASSKSSTDARYSRLNDWHSMDTSASPCPVSRGSASRCDSHARSSASLAASSA